MKEYESIFVLDPDVDDTQVDAEVERLREVITGGSGEVTEVQKWGRRKLAYEIRKKKEGVYTLIRFTADADILNELNRRYRLNESLLRHLTVVYEPSPAGEAPEGAEAETGAAPEPVAATAPAATAPGAAPAAPAAAAPAAAPAPEAAPAAEEAAPPSPEPEAAPADKTPAEAPEADGPEKE